MRSSERRPNAQRESSCEDKKTHLIIRSLPVTIHPTHMADLQLQDMLLFFRRREGHAVTSVFNRRGVVVSEAASDPSLALGT